MTGAPSQNTVDAWVRLVRAQRVALSAVETALKKAALPPLGWYDALLELERAGGDGMRPFELEKRLLLPQYGLSRLLARLEAAGYVKRRPSRADARGQIVVINAAGRAVRARMWPVYAAALQAAIGDRLDDAEAGTLATLLGKIAPPHG